MKAKALPGLDQAVLKHCMPKLERLRKNIEADVRREAPVGETGYLQSSVWSKLHPISGRIDVGAYARYALPVEVGHYQDDGSHVIENRFLLRGLMKNAGKVE